MSKISGLKVIRVTWGDLKIGFFVKFYEEKKGAEKNERWRVIPGNGLVENPFGTMKRYFPTVFYTATVKQQLAVEKEINLALKENAQCQLKRGWFFKEIKNTIENDEEQIFEAMETEEMEVEFYKHNNFRIPKTFCKNNILRMIGQSKLDVHQKRVVIPLLTLTLMATLTFAWKRNLKIRPNFIVSLTGKQNRTLEKLALVCCNVYDRVQGLSASAYSDIHILPEDSQEVIQRKAYLCKDSVLIAFYPTKKQCEYLKELYTDIKSNVNGMCLIVTETQEQIPFQTLNIPVLDKTNLEFLSDEKKDYFVGYLDFFVKSVKAEFGSLMMYHYEVFRNCAEKDIIRNFMYRPLDFFCQKIKDERYDEYKKMISELISESYPNKNQVSHEGKMAAIRICKNFDAYFDKQHKKALVKKGGKSSIASTRAWYDDECIYVTAEVLNDIQRIFNGKSLTNEDKWNLANCELIKIKSDNKKTEYCIRVSPPICEIADSDQRYYAFKRKNCEYFFENICSIINQTDHVKFKYIDDAEDTKKKITRRSTVENRIKIITGFAVKNNKE